MQVMENRIVEAVNDELVMIILFNCYIDTGVLFVENSGRTHGVWVLPSGVNLAEIT